MLEDNYLRIEIHEAMLVMEWVGHIDTIDYRHGHQVFLKTIEETKNSFWLLDYKRSGDITYQNSEWTINNWLPKAIQTMSRVEKIAVVVPDNIFNKISLRIITTHIANEKSNAEISFFNDTEEAKVWLIPGLYPAVIGGLAP